MYKRKFLDILESLTDKEFKDFGKFLNSPFFNVNKNLIRFYEIIKKHYDTKNLSEFSPQVIYKYIYKTDKFNSSKINKLVSDFRILLENFLIHYKVEDDLIGKKAYLSKHLNGKDVRDLYEIEIEDIKKLIHSSKWDSKSYYFSKLKIMIEELSEKIHNFSNDKKVDKVENLTDSLDQFYIFIKLYICHILVQHNLIQDVEVSDYGFSNIKSLINYIEKNIDFYKKFEPRIYLYYLVLRLTQKNKEDKDYTEIEKYIQANKFSFSPEDIEFSVYTLISYIIIEFCKGKYENVNLFLNLVKKIDSCGFLEKADDISHFSFVHISNLSVFLKDYEFAELFILKYFSKIKAPYKEDSLNLSLAILRHSQKRNSEAKEHLYNVSYKTYGFYLLANGIRLRILFEENSLKKIPKAIKLFKEFLKNDKSIPKYYRSTFEYFLGYLPKLVTLKNSSVKKILEMEFVLLKENNFYGKKWMLEKLSELVALKQSKKEPDIIL